MKLTGKAKEDFERWYHDTQCAKEILQGASFRQLIRWLYDDGQGIILNAFAIEWFDSVFIHVHIEPHIGGGADVYYPTIIFRDDNFIDRYISIDNNDYFNYRQKATEAAIEKANEIYNTEHGKDI